MKTRRAVFVLLIILLSACRNRPSPAIVPLPVAAVTNSTTVVPSLTPILLSTKTSFPTLESIATVPAATLNSIATLDAIRIDLENRFPELQNYQSSCNLLACFGIETSPNGQLVYFTNNNAIDLFKKDGYKVGSYSFYEIYGYLVNYNAGYIFPVQWTKDGKHMYLAANLGGDGGPEPYFGYDAALVRVNLENGTWKDLNISGSLKISSNDQFVVFSSEKKQVRIRNFSSGQEEIYRTPDNFYYFGKYVWSPDSDKVVFVATSESWETDDREFALLMIDLETHQLSKLYQSTFPFYFPVRWGRTNEVILNKFNEWGEWKLDLAANPPTITP